MSDRTHISSGLTLSMAAAVGLAIANIYYNQPMLGVMEHDLPGPLTHLIPTATQLGYAAGLLLLVPLGDILERRTLIVGQFALLALALVGAAMAPSAATLIAASLAVGATATVAQQIVPFAAHLATPEKRGATVGTVMAGLLSGILLSRTVAGVVASHFGWRAMFWLGAPVAVIVGGWMATVLPRHRPDSVLTYPRLIASLAHLWREFPELRVAALTQALLFGAFSAFWSILALRLQEPPLSMGADVAGLFGIVGAVGILVAPLAGRIADKHGPYRVILIGTVLTLISWLIFGLLSGLAGLIVGVIVLDFAVQSCLISNQSVIYALRPQARARLNTVFMSTMFLGGAAGSAAAARAWEAGGWSAVSILGAIFGAAATLLQVRQARRRKAVA